MYEVGQRPGFGAGGCASSWWGPLIRAGGVPWVWKDSMVFRPQAWPLARSASVQVIVPQSGASISRATGLHSSIRLPPGS